LANIVRHLAPKVMLAWHVALSGNVELRWRERRLAGISLKVHLFTSRLCVGGHSGGQGLFSV
jgi:hypothetical protein